jgi:hypothetical protein
MTRYFVIADIHGDYEKLMKLIKFVRSQGGLNFKKGDILVQLGDRNDRGPDTYRVNNYFYKLQKRYPNQIVCLQGNHEDMMIQAASNPIQRMPYYANGGRHTDKSYEKIVGLYGKHNIANRLLKTDHWRWHLNQPYYYETDDYFFSHAPVPVITKRHIPGPDFRQDKETLIWSYHGDWLDKWIHPDPADGKICVYGHVHRMIPQGDGTVHVPKAERIGNCIFLDSGCGCHPDGILNCIDLSSMVVYTNLKEKYTI